MGEAIPLGSAVYVQYRNEIKDSAERETIGWLTKKVGDSVYIEHDRTIESIQTSSGSGNGIILQNKCVLEKHVICMKGERVEAGSTVCH
jgi:hypothetical protein